MSAEPSIDRRILRTKAAICQALVELIEEKGFDALSVQDITTRANINRGTFYLHYRDKFDLLEQTETKIIQDVRNIIQQADALDLADFDGGDRPLPFVVTMFEYFKENASLIHAILGLKGDIAFQSRVRKAAETFLQSGLIAGVRVENFLVPGEYLIAYLLSAHFGVIQAWLEKGCLESPEEMATILSRLSFDGPLRATGIGLS